MRSKLQKCNVLKFADRIIQFRRIEIGNYPRGEAKRDNFGSNSPPLGAQVPLDTPLLAAGQVNIEKQEADKFMEYVYIILKAFIDPVFIAIILLIIAFLLCLIGGKKKSGVLVLFLTIVILYGASIFPVANYLCYYLEKDYIINQNDKEQNIDVLVVLGGGAHDINALKNTFPSEVTSSRLLHAVDIYNIKGAKYFVCVGKGPGKIAEAELMAELAQRLGIPKEKIRIEAKSINTWASAVDINKMFANKNISIGIVTSAFHLKRAEKEFKKYFDNVVPLPSDYHYASSAENIFVKYAPQTSSLSKTSVALKEIASQLWYNVKSVTQ